MTGVVKFFNIEKGFGFIKDDSSSTDLFVHKSQVQGNISEHDKVEYEVEEGRNGPMAVKVRLIR